jgi:DNA-binding transcriptional MerR regulator
LEAAPGFTFENMTQTISAQASTLGLSADTLRYYERLGLLPPPRRTASGYRLYDEDTTERLNFICGAKRMGLRLADIKELLDIRDRGQCPCGHTKNLVKRRLAEVEAEIDQLSAVRGQLLALKRRNEECFDAAAGEWSCVVGPQKGGGT